MRIRQRRRLARRLFRLCRVDQRLDTTRVRLVADHLSTSDRRDTLAILRDFSRLVRIDGDRHRAIVESVTPLTADVRAGIQSGLVRAYGQGLDTSFTVTPQLIGGMRIQVGSHVYDASVRAKLAAVEALL